MTKDMHADSAGGNEGAHASPAATAPDFVSVTPADKPFIQRPRGYIVIDTETTGLDKRRDQILQVAALRLDASLAESGDEDDTFEARCDLGPGIVPAPGALLTTRVWPDQLEGQGRSVHRLLDDLAATLERWRWPGAVEENGDDNGEGGPLMLLGHNVIGFDEEVLRHQFWKSLHDPYTIQAAGTLRADTLVIARALHVIRPSALHVPDVVSEDGTARPSFRLGDLATANSITLGDDAHDALADVRATAALGRLIAERAPEFWTHMLGLADKRKVLSLAAFHTDASPANASASGAVDPEPQLFIRPGKTGLECFAVLPIAPLWSKPWLMLALDLSIDPGDYLDLDLAGLSQLASRDRSPFVIIRSHKQPILWPLARAFAEDSPSPHVKALAKRLVGDFVPTHDMTILLPSGPFYVSFKNPDEDTPASDEKLLAAAATVVRNRTDRILRLIRNRIEILGPLVTAAANALPSWTEPKGLDDTLYSGGFPNYRDRALRKRIRELPPEQAVQLIPEMTDLALREWAWKRLFLEAPHVLPRERYMELKHEFTQCMLTGEGGFRTLGDAWTELSALIQRHADGDAATQAHLAAIDVMLMSMGQAALAEADGCATEEDVDF